MPRTKRRTVKRSSADTTINVSDNITIANQPKTIKNLLEEFDTESKLLK